MGQLCWAGKEKNQIVRQDGTGNSENWGDGGGGRHCEVKVPVCGVGGCQHVAMARCSSFVRQGYHAGKEDLAGVGQGRVIKEKSTVKEERSEFPALFLENRQLVNEAGPPMLSRQRQTEEKNHMVWGHTTSANN